MRKKIPSQLCLSHVIFGYSVTPNQSNLIQYRKQECKEKDQLEDSCGLDKSKSK